MEENYLIHHGIKGQKWGVRRYQNADGTRTREGKEHRNALENQGRNFERSNVYSRMKMSDDELIRRIGRLEKEKKLRDLERQTYEGKDAVREVLVDSGKNTAKKVLTNGAVLLIAFGVGKAMGDSDFGKNFKTSLIKGLTKK